MNTQTLHTTDLHTGIDFIKPDEDFSAIKDNCLFGIFDGVTLLYQNPYPNPSPARIVSELALNHIFEYVELYKNSKEVNVEKVLFDAFISANNQIRVFNEQHGRTKETVDHINKQFAATVGVVGFLKDEILYIAHINDCSASVFDKNRNEKLVLKVDEKLHQDYIKYTLEDMKIGGGIAHHKYWRENVVNADITFQGKKIDFGVLNGDDRAKNFIRISKIEIEPGDKILLYSDGFSPMIQYKDFVDVVLHTNSQDELNKFVLEYSQKNEFWKEKTMIRVSI